MTQPASHAPQAAGRGPLAGVTIIEMAGMGPGPFAGMMMADAGARILRVRGRQAQVFSGAVNPLQDPLARGRTDIALDLKKPGALEVLMRLVDISDALFEGYRPGVMERLGVGPDVCLARKPSLVYGRMTGWGQTGPMASAAGHDINYIALSGALHSIGTKDRPVPPLNLVGDFGGGGAMLAFGIASALLQALRTGQGQVIDASMSDGAAYLMAPFYARAASGTFTDEREGNVLDGGAPHYGVYACADGKFISAGPLEQQFWANFLRLLGLEGDPQFAQRDDTAQWPAQRERLARIFATRTRDAWCDIFEGQDACVAPVLSLQEAPGHPHNIARGTFINAAGARIPAAVPRFGMGDGTVAPPPADGDVAHAPVFAQAGFSTSEIASLRERGVLG